MENDRKIKEEARREQRAKNIANEIYANETKNIGVIFNIQQIEKMENTEELAQEVKRQSEECKKIIDSKDSLIKDLENELVKKDEEYKDALKKMGIDIDSMIEEMRGQFYKMRELYVKELAEIEVAFRKEREAILTRNKKEIDKLLKDHDEQEKNNQQLRLDNEENYGKKLEDDRKSNIINYMAKKMLMEQEKQSIERSLEELRAVFMLNQAILEYNVKVLEEKKAENDLIWKDVDTRLKSYRTRRTQLRTKIKELEENAEKENATLTREYERVSEQFSLLQKKFQHFQQADKRRFMEIEAMNEAEVKTLMHKIIKADKVIHMQQLGVPTTKPPDYIVSYLEGTGSANTMGATAMHETSSLIDGSKAPAKSEAGEEPSVVATAPIERVNAVFMLLTKETAFLMDDKFKEMLKTMPKAQRFALQVEAICAALSIEKADIETLVNTFYAKSIKPSFMESKSAIGKVEEEESKEVKKEEEKKKAGKKPEEGVGKQEEDKSGSSPLHAPGDETDEHALNIDPDAVIDILDEFIENRRLKTELPDRTTSPSKRKKKTVESETEKIEKERMKKREHWELLTHVLDESKKNLWNSLYASLTKYYQLLQERQTLIEETGILNQQNEELKTLLNQYLLAGVNQELKVPPTQTIRLDI